MSAVDPPASARLIDQASGRHHGHPATVSLYEGEASRGYQTDYRRVPTRWVTARYYDHGQGRMRYRGQSFSGRNLDTAQRLFDATAAELVTRPNRHIEGA